MQAIASRAWGLCCALPGTRVCRCAAAWLAGDGRPSRPAWWLFCFCSLFLLSCLTVCDFVPGRVLGWFWWAFLLGDVAVWGVDCPGREVGVGGRFLAKRLAGFFSGGSRAGLAWPVLPWHVGAAYTWWLNARAGCGTESFAPTKRPDGSPADTAVCEHDAPTTERHGLCRDGHAVTCA